MYWINRKHFKMMTLVCLVLLYCVCAYAETEIKVVCEDKPDFPFLLGEGKEIQWEKPGLIVELCEMISKKLNFKFKYTREPWKRCLATLESGESDALFYASFKDERLKHGAFPFKDGKVDPSRSVALISYVFYVLNDSPITWDGKALTNIKGNVGAPLGYSIVDDLKKMGLTVDESPSTLNDLRKMMKNRLDAVASLELTGEYYLKQYPEFQGKIKKLSPPIVAKPYYIMISNQFIKKDAEFTEKIWNAAAELKESDEYKQIMKKYFE
ncbi:MAG: transporter substrate-binding domain-containing protein [Desulfobacterales bacterium]|nr:transporter substrate-binding domain-containing protein [Desulfobacterales bacterium]